jgi:hypothetical protein
MKPILKLDRDDIDENDKHYLVFGGGYEYLHTVQNATQISKIELSPRRRRAFPSRD